MRVSGFTIVSNAIRLDFPIVPAIRSILPLCDEVVVNVGPSDDGTLDLIRSIGDPAVRIIEGDWDRRLGGRVLAVETQRALASITADWAVYIQADEVLHQDGAARLRAAMRAVAGDPGVEGLLVDYTHFAGNFDWVATNRAWYRREVRAVRPGIGIRSHEEAQGFRVGPELRRVRARSTGARMFHYGWARPLAALREKRELDHAIYHGHDAREIRPPIPERFPWEVGLRRFEGDHPLVAVAWVEARRQSASPGFTRPRWSPRMVRLGASLLIERLTGWRPFEYRNYVEV
jgi:hypothetical protein